MSRGSPLAATLARLSADGAWCGYEVGRPTGDGWVGVDQILADTCRIDAWLDDLRAGAAKGRTDVAGSYLASWLGDIIAGTVIATVLREGRAWPLDPASLTLHRNRGGWFDGLAIQTSTLLALPGDPDTGNPDTVTLPRNGALMAHVATGVVAILDPLFTAIRVRAPFGKRAMWGTVGDRIAARAVQLARLHGDDGEVAWKEANALLDVVAELEPYVRTRRRLTLVEWSGGLDYLPVRGTCCLYYKVSDQEYCTSCPLRSSTDTDWQ